MGQTQPRQSMPMGSTQNADPNVNPYQAPKQLAPVPYAPFTDMMASQMPVMASPNSLNTTKPTPIGRYQAGDNPLDWGSRVAGAQYWKNPFWNPMLKSVNPLDNVDANGGTGGSV